MNRRIRNARHYGNAALAVALLGAWIAALASIGPALAQAGGGAPVAYLFCYTGSGATTSPTSFAPCSGSNPLAVTGGGGGAATIANGADVAEGSTTDAPATTPTTASPATTIALLKALNNGVTITNFPATQPVSGTVTVIGPTPDGSAASTNPVLISGTTDGTATGLVAVLKVTAGGVLSVDGSASTQPVSAASLPLPAGAATSAAQTTMATNQTAVQAPVAPGAATATKSELVGGQYNASTPVFTDGQQGSVQFDVSGNARVSLATTSSSGADAVSNGAIAFLLPRNSQSSALILSPQAGHVFNGTSWDRTRGDVTGLWVGNEARTTNKTAATNAATVRPIATTVGAAVNKPFQVPELDWSYPAAAGGISNTTTAVTMVAAAGAGIRNYLTAIQVSAGALGAASEIAVRDGAGGTVIWRGFLSTAGGNQSVNLSSPIKSTANTLLEVVTLTATITGAVYINAQGYQAP